MNIKVYNKKLAAAITILYLSCILYCFIISHHVKNEALECNKNAETHLMPSSKESETTQMPLEIETVYRFTATDGKIGIYKDDADTPICVLDVLVSTLPKSDRTMLKKGITVKSYNEMVKLIEDYTS